MQTTNVHKNNMERRIATAVVFWGLASFFLGYFQFFQSIPAPFFGITVILIMASLVLLYRYNAPFAAYSDAIPLKSIALFHAWRIFAGWLFLANTGALSQTFINNAAYGDILSGFLGLSVWVLGPTKRMYLIFNLLGTLDFITAVGTGLTLTILGDAGMGKILQLPLILIPLFGVPLSGITHIISLNRLWKMSGTPMNACID
ncbi:MAG: hypothetical protein KGS48_15465 [Bacteroidetes bacterium]|nr:hypothetical protein [Bacteroidota bacterium]